MPVGFCGGCCKGVVVADRAMGWSSTWRGAGWLGPGLGHVITWPKQASVKANSAAPVIFLRYASSRVRLGVETRRQWADKALLRPAPALLGLFSIITLFARRYSAMVRFQDRQRPHRGHQQPRSGRESQSSWLSLTAQSHRDHLLDRRQNRPRVGHLRADSPSPTTVPRRPVHAFGRRHVLGVSIKVSEAEIHRRAFLESLVARGSSGASDYAVRQVLDKMDLRQLIRRSTNRNDDHRPHRADRRCVRRREAGRGRLRNVALDG
jgi:hypothetical protein